ncbi:NMDA receptor synaptonuclear signaling and neuronal migration factor isoform X4 [Denticeps clupeoides]|uniref:NMDA receptor synaptonuclear signaling and neuronal migration factor isoform X4 n=1 Tax=Denticeps clupeoides TaxID=299321 RepID=UPI0010A2E1C2|nr:NMDA receptor synaptonuclear signaling and neuronal migration factor isoform X4 [Denticeps clupeoides]
MGTAVSKRKNLRNDAISSVAAKVRAARAFGEYLSQNHPENQNGSDHLLSDTFVAQDSPDISRLNNNLQPLYPNPSATSKPSQAQPAHLPLPPTSSKRRLSVERSFSSESETTQHQPSQQKLKGGVETSLKPAQVYTITREGGMLGGRSSEESLELEVLKGGGEQSRPPSHPNGLQQLSVHQPSRNHHRSSHQRGNHSRSSHQPLQSSGSAHNIRDWGGRRGGSREDCTPDCVTCIRPPCTSQRSLDLETSPRDTAKHRKKLDRGFSEDRTSAEEREDNSSSWFPNENMFSFQTATTTMQAAFRGMADRKRRKREQETALMERNFRKHLRMVGSRRMKAQAFSERKAKSFSRSWSDPTPIKPDSLHDSRDSGDLQTSSGTLDEEVGDEVDWEEEREMERAACEGDDFIPPKIMLISSKVPKAEYVPNIIRRDDPSIIPILYDHEHATFDDILDEVEKKLTAYRKGCKIWNMLIFCQGGPGHLYLLKNKVATFAKVEKEEDMSNFWRRLSRMMSLLNPKPNLIHIMGCYVLGNANGEKLFQNLKRLMRPYSIEFKSPLELSAQGKDMIEMYFDFRLFRLWKTRQHSKLLDYDDLL